MFKMVFGLILFFMSITAHAETIEVNGVVRSYILDKTSRRPAPLIVILHGRLGSAKQIRKHTDLTGLANSVNISVLYPDGIDHAWSDGRLNPSGQPVTNVDDVGFLTKLVNKLISEGIADPERIIFTGWSNGGMMSFKMACDSTLKIWGIAPVSANMP